MEYWKSESLTKNCPGKHSRYKLLRHTFGCYLQRMIQGITSFIPRYDGRANLFDLSEVDITLPRLSRKFEGYRIVHLSDIHYGTWIDDAKLTRIVAWIDQQNADAVVITGDFISYLTAGLFKKITPLLSQITAKDGIFTVRGNHDCWACPGQFEEIMYESHIHILNNRVFTIRRSSDCLHLCGLDTVFYEQSRLDWVVNQIPVEGAAILLVHEPDIADSAAAYSRFDLQLSGHTHGGQIVFPLIGSPWLPRLARKYPSGLYYLGNMLLYTNRGIGTASLPLRFRCPPEIAIFTLHSPQAAP